MGGAILFMAVILGLITFFVYRSVAKISKVLKREAEMTAVANGTITDLIQIRRRNRSFRWTDEIPVVSYTVNGQTYQLKLDFAEKRAGFYNMGGACQVRYVPSEPSCALVEDVKPMMKRVKNINLVTVIVLAFFTLNLISAAIGSLTGLF